MRKFLALILLLFILTGVPANAQTRSKNTKTNSATTVSTAERFGNTDGITTDQLRNYLEFIASDSNKIQLAHDDYPSIEGRPELSRQLKKKIYGGKSDYLGTCKK